jgi:hypothetical protein
MIAMKLMTTELFKEVPDFGQELKDIRAEQIKRLSDIYELTIDHSNNLCSCRCTPLIEESRSYPTIKEQEYKKKHQHHPRGRPPDFNKALWSDKLKILGNPIYDNQDHENGNCSCKCTTLLNRSSPKPKIAKRSDYK